MPTKSKKTPITKLPHIDFTKVTWCRKPCHIDRYVVEENTGGRHNPFHWQVNVGGYPIVNVVIQFRGKVGKYFQVQLRHHHPGASIGPTMTYTFERELGTLGAAGFEMASFNGVRPLQPELDIIAFSDDEEDFDVVAATIYATQA